MLWYVLLIAAVAVERVVELVVSTRNLAWSRARGGVEFGARHYPTMVVLHIGLLAGCLVETLVAHRPFLPLLGWSMLAVVAGAGVHGAQRRAAADPDRRREPRSCRIAVIHS